MKISVGKDYVSHYVFYDFILFYLKSFTGTRLNLYINITQHHAIEDSII